MGRLFGTDGVRGTYGDDLTDDLARSLGYAAASVLGRSSAHPRIIIGRDTRASSPALERALASGIAAAGGEPLSAGVIPTPGVAFLVREIGADAGAVISASHNPARDNGIKFFGPDGMKLPDALEDDVEAQMAPVEAPVSDPVFLADAEERYVEFLLKDTPSLEGLRVVVDCAHGAACNVAPEVYRGAGATVAALFADPDGSNINDGCGSTHPERLQEEVRRQRAHIGVAHDGDADRMIAVDERGCLVDGDQALGIFALDLKARRALPGDAIVSTVMANLGFRRAMSEGGINVVETQVGDRYVLQSMLENGVVLGGEQSGHIVFLDRHTTGDGILTALRLMTVLHTTGRSLSEAAAAIPRFPQVLVNVPVRDRGALPGADAVWNEVRAVEEDLGAAGRVLVRASGTEQLVRVMVEADTEARAASSADRIVQAVRIALA